MFVEGFVVKWRLVIGEDKLNIDIVESYHFEHCQKVIHGSFLCLSLQVCVGVVRQIHLRDTRRMFCPVGHWLSSRVSLPLGNNCQTVSFVPRTNRRQRRLFTPQRLLTRDELGKTLIIVIGSFIIYQVFPWWRWVIDGVPLFYSVCHLTASWTSSIHYLHVNSNLGFPP